MKIVLPENGPKPSYYAAYVGYIRKLLEYNGVSYTLHGTVNVGEVVSPTATKFLMRMDDKRIIIDYSDNLDYMPSWNEFDGYFKFHYCSEKHKHIKNARPFTPISFYDWNQYEKLKKEIMYTCNNDIVLNMQQPKANALKRRTYVQTLLKQRYKNNVILHSNETQPEYWKRINNCLVHVFVPGCRNDMIDRGHLQYMAFGCCTIAPPIIDELPYDKKPIPGIHYIQCLPDYSDLVEKIEWCRTHRNDCCVIGIQAKQLFEDSCTPKKLWTWIMRNV